MLTAQAQPSLLLKDQSIQLSDQALWHVLPDYPSEWSSSLEQAKLLSGSIIGRSGAFVASIPLSNQNAHTWFVISNSNYLDQGAAYWQPDQGMVYKVADFSHYQGKGIPSMLHAQVFPLKLQDQASGRLWVVISALHYPTPVPLSFATSSDFYHNALIVNTVTVGSVAIMLTLAMIALMIALRTNISLAFWCAGYVGLHGIGWAMASGLVNDLVPTISVNLTYGGMYLFPFAIACAAMFSKGLFASLIAERRLGKVLHYFAVLATALGVAMVFLPFQVVFYLSHFIAMIWVPLSLYIGITMRSKQDFRAKYYLTGSVLYSTSLLYYVLSHGHVFGALAYPELAVLSALTLDCICIMLSLSEWLHIKQRDHIALMFEARIDPLTQVGNRFALNEALEKMQEHYCIVFIDFDGVKSINDHQGHKAGDQFLKDAANLMRQHIPSEGQVFRVGGDEFVWLISTISAETVFIATLLHSGIQETELALKKRWKTSGISYGIVDDKAAPTPNESLAIADQRMYEHKASKRAAT